MAESTKITQKIAKRFLDSKGTMDLGEFTSLDDAAAELLATYDGELFLCGIANLSLPALKSLGMHRGDQFLGIRSLSEEAAEVLARHNGFLVFTDLPTISDVAASALSGHEGGLRFDALEDISQSAASDLSKTKGDLGFSVLTKLTQEAASELAEHDGSLTLGGLEKLDIATARALSKHQGLLDLSGLGTLSGAAAQALADKAGGGLVLEGLDSFSDTVAEALARFEGELFLDSVLELSDRAAVAFSTHAGTLSLLGLSKISESALLSLRECKGLRVNEKLEKKLARLLRDVEGSFAEDGSRILTKRLAEKEKKRLDGFFGFFQSVTAEAAAYLATQWRERSLSLDGLYAVSPSVAKALAEHAGSLNLSKVESLSDESAELLSRHKGDMLVLTSVRELSDRGATALANYRGEWLHLGNLSTVSDFAIRSLATFQGHLSLGLNSLSSASGDALAERAGGLSLERITDLSDAFVPLLERVNSQSKYVSDGEIGLVTLGFSEVSVISDAAAEALAHYPEELELFGVRSLSDAAAEALARRPGRLNLSGLEELSAKAAEAIATRRGRLELPRFTKISADVAAALATHQGPLSLGLISLTKPVATALAKHQGELTLMGLEDLKSDCALEICKHGNLVVSDEIKAKLDAAWSS